MSSKVESLLNKFTGEGLRKMRPWGRHILPSAISVPKRRRNTKLEGISAHTRTRSGENLTTSVKIFGIEWRHQWIFFRHFWSNVQGFALAGLAPKLWQIVSVPKSRGSTMKCTIWSMVSDLTSGQLFGRARLEVKLYLHQTLFSKPYVFLK